jgi:hypothetical protein
VPAEHDRQEETTATADAIYGIIVSSAVMASAYRESVLKLAGAVLVTLLVYWAAERFAHAMAHGLVGAPGWTARIGHELGRGWKFVTASFVPLGAMVVSALFGASLSNAVLIALVCATGLLAIAGWRIGRGAGLGLHYRLVCAVCAGTLGVVMIVLKTVFH